LWRLSWVSAELWACCASTPTRLCGPVSPPARHNPTQCRSWALSMSVKLDSSCTAGLMCSRTRSTACLHAQHACHMSCFRLSTGFQFNHVGGGTKTRRPITLHMKYNSSAVQPTCFLLTEDSGEQEVSLEELQVNAQRESKACRSRS
jgi:hypothetical protein